MAKNLRPASQKAPDKGSFPLDHFHECDNEAKAYTHCVEKHQLMPKRCRKFQVDYLNCRMNAGLMEKEEMEKLGFHEKTSWENEEQEKRYLFERIEKMKIKAWENSLKKAQEEFEKKKEPTEPI